jgi:hypothetical protein
LPTARMTWLSTFKRKTRTCGCQAIVGYHRRRSGGDLRHELGFIVEDSTWTLRYLVVASSNWWGGHKVLISPEWIGEVRWNDRTVSIDLTQQSVKVTAEFESPEQLDREYKEKVHHHYAVAACEPKF